MIPLAATGVTDVPEEHQAGCAEMEAVQSPDRSERQAEHVHRIDQVADVGQHDVPQAVRGEILGPPGLDEHRQGADDEDRGRYRSRQQLQTRIHVPPPSADFPNSLY
jgi:hypothetical protein